MFNKIKEWIKDIEKKIISVNMYILIRYVMKLTTNRRIVVSVI